MKLSSLKTRVKARSFCLCLAIIFGGTNMIDIKQIRQNPDIYKRAALAKKIAVDIDRLLEVDNRLKACKYNVEQLRRNRNAITDAIANDIARKEDFIGQSQAVGQELKRHEKELESLEREFQGLMAFVPGVPLADVPEGESDKDNVEISRWGQIADKDFRSRDHLELLALNKMADFEGARNIAGSRAYALIGNGALLEMAIMRFALDKILAKGFTLVAPPLMVKEIAMFGTGYFPLGGDNAYELENGSSYLTGTSEVGIVSINKDRIFDEEELPKRYVGASVCFRQEAGAAGKDTKGLYRVHQFQKIEQVIMGANDNEKSLVEHFNLLRNAEEIMQALELPYRVVLMCTADIGLGQVYKHDIETWMPSRSNYCETHSCSSFHDFQARRLNIRYKNQNGEKQLVHTLNNTAIASPRILIPFLENHQNADGSISIPVALRPYVGGLEVLEL